MNYEQGFTYSTIMYISQFEISNNDVNREVERIEKLIENGDTGDTTMLLHQFPERFVHLDGIDYYILLPKDVQKELFFNGFLY